MKPDFLFETSWEVCNKVGGIHTVIATKATSLKTDFNDKHIMIGPDLVHTNDDLLEFEPDEKLYAEWRKKAQADGLRVKVGRWKIPSSPIAILVDFSALVARKDEIFSQFWEDYKLDSLSGQWDYIESAMFGYAAGETIESFIRYNLKSEDKVVAQFHEWMTGAGVLYLKKHLPQVATAFTTHATVVGRSLAGNNRALYDNLGQYNADVIAKELNIVSKQSLEKLAAQHADTFTTVSDITAAECQQFLGRPVDIVTPNGFEDTAVPSEPVFTEKRETARQALLGAASALMGETLPKDTFVVATSGRYEYRNKGIDLFLESLMKIQESGKLDRPLLACLFIPANHYGARKELQAAMEKGESCDCGMNYMTHYLHDSEWDPILQTIKKHNFVNSKDSNLKIMFVPSYLKGDDGIFDLPYYDLLIGCDQTVFPSYYEPWGYTPLESLAYHVPTVTTSLAGFGVWMRNESKGPAEGVAVIERNDQNDGDVIEDLKTEILRNFVLKRKETDIVRKNAFQTSQTALWKSLVFFYKQAYGIALEKAEARADQFVNIDNQQTEKVYEEIRPLSNQPQWKRIIVKSQLPKELELLNDIVDNIWWTWDDEAQAIFRDMDPEKWRLAEFNPMILFEHVSYDRLKELSEDKIFVGRVKKVYQRLQDYLKGKEDLTTPHIAYFSMEYGFHDSLKLYSGGLGILAGDYLKEASDAKVNITAFGLLYRHGYFTQVITNKGEQQANYDYQHFSKLPVHPVRKENGDFETIEVMLPGRSMHARIWYLEVGRIRLYLLDTDFDWNLDEDRVVSHQLYGGDNENRLKQELLLGVGGIRALGKLGIKPNLFHLNEGHSAFITLERIRRMMKAKQFTFTEAKEIVRSSTLFTTHTPVPAGHDHFDEDLIRRYMGHYPSRINISWEEFMALGRSNPNDWGEKFNMSYLAAHLSQEVNGVSMLHGEVTKDMFAHLWPGYLPEELHVHYVTNGVHWPTWTAPEWKEIYEDLFDNNFVEDQMDFSKWEKIQEVDDKKLWDVKQGLRKKLIDLIKGNLQENWVKRHEDPKNMMTINNTLSDKVLTIVFARRFATYKRAHLLFKDLDRLSKILNNPERPIQFIFAGKAHPADGAGQGLIKMIVDISKRPEFLGKIMFLQNYSIELAKYLVSGADIWLNTPTRPLEASGTSGEKAVMNGTMHFSVLDGWWVEGYKPDAGWALTSDRSYENQEFQDDLDAETIYSLFENEILPDFYERGKDNIPNKWISYIKNTIAGVSPNFTTRRMINDYQERFYNKLYNRSKDMFADNYAKIIDLAGWKKRIERTWGNMEVLEVKLLERNTETIQAGSAYEGHVVLSLGDIDHEHVGVELVVSKDYRELVELQEFEFAGIDNGNAEYKISAVINRPGTFQYGIRVFPKHDLLAHRQDFAILQWI